MVLHLELTTGTVTATLRPTLQGSSGSASGARLAFRHFRPSAHLGSTKHERKGMNGFLKFYARQLRSAIELKQVESRSGQLLCRAHGDLSLISCHLGTNNFKCKIVC